MAWRKSLRLEDGVNSLMLFTRCVETFYDPSLLVFTTRYVRHCSCVDDYIDPRTDGGSSMYHQVVMPTLLEMISKTTTLDLCSTSRL